MAPVGAGASCGAVTGRPVGNRQSGPAKGYSVRVTRTAAFGRSSSCSAVAGRSGRSAVWLGHKGYSVHIARMARLRRGLAVVGGCRSLTEGCCLTCRHRPVRRSPRHHGEPRCVASGVAACPFNSEECVFMRFGPLSHPSSRRAPP